MATGHAYTDAPTPALIVDEGGRLLDMVAQTDLLVALCRASTDRPEGSAPGQAA